MQLRGSVMPNMENCLFKAERICKSFGAVHALVDFDITVGGISIGDRFLSYLPLTFMMMAILLKSRNLEKIRQAQPER